MSKENWISKTNQMWKILSFGVLMVVDVLLFLGLILRTNFPSGKRINIWVLDEVTLALSFIIVGLIAFTVIWFFIKCPVCKKNVGSLIIKTNRAGIWFTKLISLQTCPHCDDDGCRNLKRSNSE